MRRQCAVQTAPSRLILLRRLCWTAVLSHESMVATLCGRTAADGWRTNGAFMALCTMYRHLRDAPVGPGAPRIDHEAATLRLIAAIGEADSDDLWLDRVIADMVSLQECEDGASCPGLIHYLTSVRASYFVLCMERRRAMGATPLRGLPRG
jgi:hypothetical protein